MRLSGLGPGATFVRDTLPPFPPSLESWPPRELATGDGLDRPTTPSARLCASGTDRDAKRRPRPALLRPAASVGGGARPPRTAEAHPAADAEGQRFGT